VRACSLTDSFEGELARHLQRDSKVSGGAGDSFEEALRQAHEDAPLPTDMSASFSFPVPVPHASAVDESFQSFDRLARSRSFEIERTLGGSLSRSGGGDVPGPFDMLNSFPPGRRSKGDRD